jgi:hypothetical protein
VVPVADHEGVPSVTLCVKGIADTEGVPSVTLCVKEIVSELLFDTVGGE